MSKRSGPYPESVREEAVRLFRAHRAEYDSEWAAMKSIAAKFGATAETVRLWVRQADVDDGVVDGVSREERQRIKELERENRELRRANEILKAASVFFAAELDPRPKR